MTAQPAIPFQPHTRLSEEPLIHPTAQVTASTLGRYTEIAERAKVSECELGDYSYMMQECEVWAARIGKFANIASHVRINATNHPVWRATLHISPTAPTTTGRMQRVRRPFSIGGAATA